MLSRCHLITAMKLTQTGVAVLLAVALLVSTAAPAVAESEETLTVDVEQGDAVTVTVTQNGTAVENATVTADGLNNSTYAGDGTTDENGTVALPEPSENVTVEVTATAGNATTTTTVDLVAETDDEKEEDDAQMSFGQEVSSFVQGMLDAGEEDGPLGTYVSEYVTSNNPGADKKPDHAGPENKTNKTAKKDDANKGNDNRPDHVKDKGPNSDDEDVESEDEDDEDEDDDEKQPGNKNKK